MKVVITEKPSVAREIASVLKIQGKRNGFIEGRGCAITWAFGHLVTLQEPGEYDPELKRWSVDKLPFVPEQFRLKLIGNSGVAEQFAVIKQLFVQAEEIVCATDAGREGELIFRYILALSGCEQKPIRRLWLNSLTPEAIKDAFANLRNGHDLDSLYHAARCRSESDWIVGLNATRYYTVRHGRLGTTKDRVLWSIGRVQTPVLAMIVERDDAIEQFRSQPFWELATRYRDTIFKHTGKRFDTPEPAQALLDKVKGEQLKITRVEGKDKKELPPQLFDLTTLQRDMNRIHALSAADTLTATQNLYENKLVTYPRTDSRYLNQDMKKTIPTILAKLKNVYAQEVGGLNLAKLPFSNRIIDDKKVTDHHAIIPTGERSGRLSVNESKVYEAIVMQFIAAFYPACLKRLTTVDAECEGVAFQAKGTQIIKPGWTQLFPKKGKSTEEDEEQALPEFKSGEAGLHDPFLREGKTSPPKHYTENSLLGAMEAAGKLVEDDQLREALKERGIGTPATRAAIIETLLTRNYIRREKRLLRCTDMGRCLIALVRDPLLKSPEMTGEWEGRLKQIEKKELSPESFMQEIQGYVHTLIDQGDRQVNRQRIGSCPLCGKEVIQGKRAYGCSDWKAGCLFVLNPDYKGIVLTRWQIQTLLQQRILFSPVTIEGELRLLILSTQGAVMDLALPAPQGQKKYSQKSTVAKAATQKGSAKKAYAPKTATQKSSIKKTEKRARS